jgi:hypothetical protein
VATLTGRSADDIAETAAIVPNGGGGRRALGGDRYADDDRCGALA